MTKRHDVDSGSSDGDGDEGSHHDDKVALRWVDTDLVSRRTLQQLCRTKCDPLVLLCRRARNREAARRVRERRMNTIRTLSEQVSPAAAVNHGPRQQTVLHHAALAMASNNIHTTVQLGRSRP
jgi:hypothetical protein